MNVGSSRPLNAIQPTNSRVEINADRIPSKPPELYQRKNVEQRGTRPFTVLFEHCQLVHSTTTKKKGKIGRCIAAASEAHAMRLDKSLLSLDVRTRKPTGTTTTTKIATRVNTRTWRPTPETKNQNKSFGSPGKLAFLPLRFFFEEATQKDVRHAPHKWQIGFKLKKVVPWRSKGGGSNLPLPGRYRKIVRRRLVRAGIQLSRYQHINISTLQSSLIPSSTISIPNRNLTHGCKKKKHNRHIHEKS